MHAPAIARVLAGALVAAVAMPAWTSPGDHTVPFPAGPSAIEAASLRLSLAPEPDGSFRVETTATLRNPTEEAQALELVLGGPGSGSGIASLAGEALQVRDDGPGPRLDLKIEPLEVVVLSISQRVVPALAPALHAPAAGWWGQARGHLLQPMHQLAIRVDPARGFTGCAVEVVLDLPGQPLATAVFARPRARYDRGRVSAQLDAENATLTVAWPVVENETFLPRTAGEAENFLRAWDGGLADREIRLVRFGIMAAHASALSDAEAARELAPDRRPGWSRGPAGPTDDERAAMAVLAEAEDAAAARTRIAAAPRLPAPPPPPGAQEVPEVSAEAPPARSSEPRPAPAEPTEEEPAVAESSPGQGGTTNLPGQPTAPAEATAAAETPPVSPKPPPPPVPWLHDAARARLFVATERAAGTLDLARLDAAIDLIEARQGNPFEGRPETRARFDAEAWYEPESRWTSQRLSSLAREAIAVLRAAAPRP